MADLANLDLTPLSAPISADEVAAYRAAREVEGLDPRESFDEQKDALSRRGGGAKAAGIVFGVVSCVVGAPLALLTALVLVMGEVAPPAVVGLIFGAGFLWLGVGTLRSMRRPLNDATWRERYRFDAFARANGFTYVFRTRPDRVAYQGPSYAVRTTGRTLTDVLRPTSGQRVLLGRLAEFRTRSNREYTVVALGTGAQTPKLRLTHRAIARKNETDPVLAHFKVVDGRPEDAVRCFTPEVVAAIRETAPRFDLRLSGGTLYLLRDDRVGNRDVKALRRSLRIAATVGPLITQAAARAAQHPQA